MGKLLLKILGKIIVAQFEQIIRNGGECMLKTTRIFVRRKRQNMILVAARKVGDTNDGSFKNSNKDARLGVGKCERQVRNYDRNNFGRDIRRSTGRNIEEVKEQIGVMPE